MSNGKERRKYKRTKKPYTIRFRVKQFEGDETIPTGWDMVAVKDLSAGGAFFICTCNKSLEVGSLLDLKIDVSTAIPTINCVGKVIRSDKLLSPSVFCIAIEFTEIDEKEKEMINTTIEEVSE